MISFRIFLIILILLSSHSCSRLDSHTQIVGEGINTKRDSQEEVAKKAIQESLLTNRQSLRIALLKIEIDKKSSKKIVIFGDELFPFGKLGKFTPDIVVGHHQKLFPEYYRLLNLAERKRIPLIYVCQVEWKCELIKKGLSPYNRARAQFLKDEKSFKKVDQSALYFSLGGRSLRSKSSNAMWQYPLFDLRFPATLEQLEFQSWLNLQDIPNK